MPGGLSRPYVPLLKSKGTYKHNDRPMAHAWSMVPSLVPRWWVAGLIDKAAHSAARAAEAYGSPVYAWSGGKDSIALEVVMERAGIERGVICACPLDFDDFVSWARDHRPAGVVTQDVGWLNEDWLLENPEFLFCNRPGVDGRLGARFTTYHHRDPLRRAYEHMGAGVMFTGRRSQDKNAKADPAKPTKSGYRYCNPIFDWNHEEVMAAIQYAGKVLPACYHRYPGGWYDGPTSWPARTFHHPAPERAWAETYRIAPALVSALAADYTGAARAVTASPRSP